MANLACRLGLCMQYLLDSLNRCTEAGFWYRPNSPPTRLNINYTTSGSFYICPHHIYRVTAYKIPIEKHARFRDKGILDAIAG